MTYIIENANILKENELVTTSLLVKEKEISLMGSNFRKYSYTRMNAEPFIMTPTYVFFDTGINQPVSFQQKKDYYMQNFILRGCTTLLTYFQVNYERDLQINLKNMKVELLNSPIDYVIGVKIPLKLLSPSFVRTCKKEKLPAIFIELRDTDDLSTIPWGWIREAMFPYNCPLIPVLSIEDKRLEKKILTDWKNYLSEQKIPHLDEPLVEKTPLSIPTLSKIGIYPLKSCLIQGQEISYNLYKRNREVNKIDVMSLFHYHDNRLLVTVHKGVVIRAGEREILFRSGFGEYVLISKPSYFSIS